MSQTNVVSSKLAISGYDSRKLTHGMTQGKLLNLFVPWFLHYYNRENNSTYFIEPLRELTAGSTALAQQLTFGICSTVSMKE